MIMEPSQHALVVSAGVVLLGPAYVLVHVVVGLARPHRQQRGVALLPATVLSAAGAAHLVYMMVMIGLSLGYSDAPDSTIPDSDVLIARLCTAGPALLVVAGAVAARRHLRASRWLAVTPTLLLALPTVLAVGVF